MLEVVRAPEAGLRQKPGGLRREGGIGRWLEGSGGAYGAFEGASRATSQGSRMVPGFSSAPMSARRT